MAWRNGPPENNAKHGSGHADIDPGDLQESWLMIEAGRFTLLSLIVNFLGHWPSCVGESEGLTPRSGHHGVAAISARIITGNYQATHDRHAQQALRLDLNDVGRCPCR
jgi:hypothetical protein